MTTSTITLTIQVVDPTRSMSLLKRLLARSCFKDVRIETTPRI